MEKYIERIEQLLRKAESTDSPHEAEALTAAAEKLMITYGIERVMLNLDGSTSKDEIIKERISFEGMWQTAWLDGFSYVVNSLGLVPLVSKWGGMTHLYVVGHKSDVEDAVRLIKSLQAQSLVALNYWWKSERRTMRHLTNHQRHVEKRSFVEYFGLGASRRIREQRKVAIKEAGTGTDLVLADRRDAVVEYVKNEGHREAKERKAQTGWRGIDAGVQAGHDAMSRPIDNKRGIER